MFFSCFKLETQPSVPFFGLLCSPNDNYSTKSDVQMHSILRDPILINTDLRKKNVDKLDLNRIFCQRRSIQMVEFFIGFKFDFKALKINFP
jgi:hypothetical protein